MERTLSVHAEVDTRAVEEAIRWLGWRVYATNQPKVMLPLEQAVLAYREEYLVERGFGRVKGKPLSLSPMYVQSDQRATGLVRLLSIGLRVLTLVEFRFASIWQTRKQQWQDCMLATRNEPPTVLHLKLCWGRFRVFTCPRSRLGNTCTTILRRSRRCNSTS